MESLFLRDLRVQLKTVTKLIRNANHCGCADRWYSQLGQATTIVDYIPVRHPSIQLETSELRSYSRANEVRPAELRSSFQSIDILNRQLLEFYMTVSEPVIDFSVLHELVTDDASTRYR